MEWVSRVTWFSRDAAARAEAKAAERAAKKAKKEQGEA